MDRRASVLRTIRDAPEKEAITLISGGVELVELDAEGNHPLHIAAMRGSHDIATALLKAKADVNVRNKAGFTPLRMAVRDEKAVTELLLNEKADPNLADHVGDTPLSSAAKRGNKMLLKLLLNAGAKVNSFNRKGETPLHTALLYCMEDPAEVFEVVKILLDRGADVSMQTTEGKTPLAVALAKKLSSTIVDALRNAETHDFQRLKDELELRDQHIARLKTQLAKGLPSKDRLEELNGNELDEFISDLNDLLAVAIELKTQRPYLQE